MSRDACAHCSSRNIGTSSSSSSQLHSTKISQLCFIDGECAVYTQERQDDDDDDVNELTAAELCDKYEPDASRTFTFLDVQRVHANIGWIRAYFYNREPYNTLCQFACKGVDDDAAWQPTCNAMSGDDRTTTTTTTTMKGREHERLHLNVNMAEESRGSRRNSLSVNSGNARPNGFYQSSGGSYSARTTPLPSPLQSPLSPSRIPRLTTLPSPLASPTTLRRSSSLRVKGERARQLQQQQQQQHQYYYNDHFPAIVENDGTPKRSQSLTFSVPPIPCNIYACPVRLMNRESVQQEETQVPEPQAAVVRLLRPYVQSTSWPSRRSWTRSSSHVRIGVRTAVHRYQPDTDTISHISELSLSLTPLRSRHRSHHPLGHHHHNPGHHHHDDCSDADSVRSFGSGLSVASACEHANFALNGTTWSGRQHRYIVHCSTSNLNDGDEYLTPTQRAQRQVRKFQALLKEAHKRADEQEHEIARLSQELVELRIKKVSPVEEKPEAEIAEATTAAAGDTDEDDDDEDDDAVCSVRERIPTESSPVKAAAPPVVEAVAAAAPPTPASAGSSSNASSQPCSPPPPLVIEEIVCARRGPASLSDSGHFDQDEVERLRRQHCDEISEVKRSYNDKVENLLGQLQVLQTRLHEERPALELAESRSRKLEEELERSKRQLEEHKALLQEQEERNKHLYLMMYSKGREAARFEASDGASTSGSGSSTKAPGSPSKITVAELLQKLTVTEAELDNVKNDTVIFSLEPFHCIFFRQFVLETNFSSLPPSTMVSPFKITLGLMLLKIIYVYWNDPIFYKSYSYPDQNLIFDRHSYVNKTHVFVVCEEPGQQQQRQQQQRQQQQQQQQQQQSGSSEIRCEVNHVNAKNQTRQCPIMLTTHDLSASIRHDSMKVLPLGVDKAILSWVDPSLPLSSENKWRLNVVHFQDCSMYKAEQSQLKNLQPVSFVVYDDWFVAIVNSDQRDSACYLTEASTQDVARCRLGFNDRLNASSGPTLWFKQDIRDDAMIVAPLEYNNPSGEHLLIDTQHYELYFETNARVSIIQRNAITELRNYMIRDVDWTDVDPYERIAYSTHNGYIGVCARTTETRAQLTCSQWDRQGQLIFDTNFVLGVHYFHEFALINLPRGKGFFLLTTDCYEALCETASNRFYVTWIDSDGNIGSGKSYVVDKSECDRSINRADAQMFQLGPGDYYCYTQVCYEDFFVNEYKEPRQIRTREFKLDTKCFDDDQLVQEAPQSYWKQITSWIVHTFIYTP
ncbi:unnamed protein product [Trichogramma brassicae]|uniref:Uncharacterized protein n=1 Tax=Trichogramma brassicae TaxID=86971 RepID=A0A6H5HU88_9HYME|nr:unnamed protein product [Trichogramma brassicae]